MDAADSDILFIVLSWVAPPARPHMRLVCQQWRLVLDAPACWRDLGDGEKARMLGSAKNADSAEWACHALYAPMIRDRGALHTDAWRRSGSMAALLSELTRMAWEHEHAIVRHVIGVLGLSAIHFGAAGPAPGPTQRESTCGNVLFSTACECGRLDEVQWATETLGVPHGEGRTIAAAQANRRKTVSGAFAAAAEGGHLPVLQYLADRFGLTPEDARFEHNRALGGACMNGHLAVAQWLTSTFGLGLEDAQAQAKFAWGWAVLNGHKPIQEWLVAEFGADVADNDVDDGEERL